MNKPLPATDFLKPPSPAEWAEALDETVNLALNRETIPGAVLALVRDGEVQWSRAWGFANAATESPMREHLPFEAASLAKPVTAYLALSLCAEGLLQLDSPLASYLPADPPPGLPPNHPLWQHITLRHVLSHTSGLSHSNPPVILASPGENFRYSLGGFALLQRVLEHLTGQDLQELATERVFQPFGMKESSFLVPQDFDEIAHGHDAEGRPLPLPKAGKARAWNSLWTSAPDYARFLAQISKSASDPHLESIWQTMLQPQIELHDELSWTLGWGLQEGRSGPILWHWGGPRGGRHYVALSPAHGLGLVLLTNSSKGEALWPQIVASAMGGHHPILPWGGSLWSLPDREEALARVERLQHRHQAFAASLGRTLSKMAGFSLRVERSFTELAPYSECVLMASRFPTGIVPLSLGSGKVDAILNLPLAVLRGLLGQSDPEMANRQATPEELPRMRAIAHRIAQDLNEAWDPEGPTLDSIHLEKDPQAVELAGPNDPILLLGFQIATSDAAASDTKQPAAQRYRLAFTVGYPLSQL